MVFVLVIEVVVCLIGFGLGVLLINEIAGVGLIVCGPVYLVLCSCCASALDDA